MLGRFIPIMISSIGLSLGCSRPGSVRVCGSFDGVREPFLCRRLGEGLWAEQEFYSSSTASVWVTFDEHGRCPEWWDGRVFDIREGGNTFIFLSRSIQTESTGNAVANGTAWHGVCVFSVGIEVQGTPTPGLYVFAEKKQERREQERMQDLYAAVDAYSRRPVVGGMVEDFETVLLPAVGPDEWCGGIRALFYYVERDSDYQVIAKATRGTMRVTESSGGLLAGDIEADFLGFDLTPGEIFPRVLWVHLHGDFRASVQSRPVRRRVP